MMQAFMSQQQQPRPVRTSQKDLIKKVRKGNDEVKRILELELRVRQMERELKEKDAKLRQVVTVEQERIEMLEKRVLGKFKAIDDGTRATKTKSKGGST